MDTMKYIVTGGAGFIGSHIVDALVNQGEQVTVIDNLSTGNINNLEESKDKIKFVEGDIIDLDLLQNIFDEGDIIFHQAARPSVKKSVEDPILTNNINIQGTLNVLVAAKDNKCKRVIFASSSSVYGDSKTLPKVESMTPNPKSPYALTKYAGEVYLKQFHDLFGLETLSIRYFNVFGPRQTPDSEYSAVIPKFIKFISEDKTPVIYGDGTQSRDFTFIKNVVHANILAAKANVTKGEVINVACNDRIDLNELAKKLNVILNKNLEPTYDEPRLGDVKHSQADINKAKLLIGYEPIVDFETGLKMTVDWYCKISN
jgi:nucleoside-diphosphate-sugar epimerase